MISRILKILYQVDYVGSDDVSDVTDDVNQRHALRPHYGRQHLGGVLETNIRGDIDTEARQNRHGDG